jgi:hypothetical protein
MSLIVVAETDRSQPDAQALIAEARAHARRRRLKVAAALVVLAITVAAGVLIGRTVTSSPAAAQADRRPALPAAATGIVTGHLAACFALPTTPPRVTPGTVVALRGRVNWKPDGPGAWRLVFPKGPAVASEHISSNYDQTFRFALPPGHYVIAGRYDFETGHVYYTFSEVTVTVGAVIRMDLQNACD